jgi:hypothetical protein
MAVAKAATKLSLDAFARVMQINPLHFNSVTLPGANTTCGEPLYQYGWQAADKVSREEIAQVIADAERLIENHLHYRLLPSYEVDERHALDPRMWQPRFHTDWGYVQSGGQQTRSAIATASPITWSPQQMLLDTNVLDLSPSQLQSLMKMNWPSTTQDIRVRKTGRLRT